MLCLAGSQVARPFAPSPYADLPLERAGTCVLCGETEARSLFDLQPFSYRRCVSCGLVRLDPPVHAGSLDLLYEPLALKAYVTPADDLLRQLRNPTFAWRLSRITRHASGRFFYELGCGDGNFLRVLRDSGWHVAGGEMAAAAA
jgi:hypothetical protein